MIIVPPTVHDLLPYAHQAAKRALGVGATHLNASGPLGLYYAGLVMFFSGLPIRYDRGVTKRYGTEGRFAGPLVGGRGYNVRGPWGTGT